MAEFGEIAYSLSAIRIATYNIATDTYGATVVSLDQDQILDFSPQADNDTMRDSGKITKALTVTTHGEIQIQAGGYDFSAWAVLFGASNATSGTTPNQVRTTTFPDIVLGYFGAIGEAVTDDGGLLVIGLRCCKLNNRPKTVLDGQENKFIIQDDLQGMALYVGNVLDEMKTYETPGDYTAPTDAATFKAFFSA